MIDNTKKKHLLFDLTIEYPKRAYFGISFSARRAAKLIGIPVSALNHLREFGFFRHKYLGYNITSYHEHDVLEFKKRLLNLNGKLTEISTDQHISLEAVMRMKFRGDERKAMIIQEVLSENIPVLGRYGSKPNNLILSKQDIDIFLKK